ncbi:glycosyltransferase [Hoeflea poritis]|uniref:Glycosyltransferase n=1 Tax=Hoeflea poritis TaxID=2993659 RepID=A0ABT4VNQ3_9HYPH|nr:glycosyltransferase [Hoeflea poritis]MDA4846343.1 glycosyltransferase [Hoeflea poritis]
MKHAGKVAIVDPEYQSLGGHHLTSLELLERALHPLCPACHVNSRSPQEIANVLKRVHLDFVTDPAQPARRRRIRNSNPARWYLMQAVRRLKGLPADTIDGTDYADEMFAVLSRYGPGDHLIFPTTKVDTHASLLAAIARIQPDNMPHLHLRFLEYAPKHDRSLATQCFGRLATLSRMTNRIHIYTETETLRRNLIDRFGFEKIGRVILQPSRITSPACEKRPSDNQKIRIGYVGGNLRKDKGYERLPAILSLASRKMAGAPYADTVRFVIQIADSRRGQRLKRRLRGSGAIPSGQLDFVSGPLDLTEFSALLASCDLLLFPYTRDKSEQMISSGILIDSVINGVPAICPPVPTLTEFISTETGAVADSDEEFAEAIMRLISNIGAYKAQAELASEKYADAWRSNDLVDLIRDDLQTVQTSI